MRKKLSKWRNLRRSIKPKKSRRRSSRNREKRIDFRSFLFWEVNRMTRKNRKQAVN